MGLEELLHRLERDADKRVADIEARARGEIEAIEATAAQESSRESEAALTSLRTQRRARLEHELSEVRRAARADRLRAEHALLERVLGRAAELLDGITIDDRYLSAVSARLLEALLFVEGRAARVRCRPALAPALRRATSARADVTVEEIASMPAGFSVVTGDGSVEVDDTLATRLQRMRPRLMLELLAEVDRR